MDIWFKLLKWKYVRKLAIACRAGELEQVKYLLEKINPVEPKFIDGFTYIGTYVEKDLKKKAKALKKVYYGLPSYDAALKRIAKILKKIDYALYYGFTSYDLGTPLGLAILGGNISIIKLLLEKGADPNCNFCGSEDSKITPLGIAAATNNIELATALISAGADFSYYYSGVKYKDSELVCTGLFSYESRYYYYLPLEIAAMKGHLELIQFLLEMGADPNNGNALSWAISRPSDNQSKICSLLLHYGANPNGNPYIYSSHSLATYDPPICAAAWKGNIQIIKLLLEAGADVINRAGNYGNQAINIAVKLGDLEVVKFLLENGADVNAKDDCGMTPLKRVTYEIEMNQIRGEKYCKTYPDASEIIYLLKSYGGISNNNTS